MFASVCTVCSYAIIVWPEFINKVLFVRSFVCSFVRSFVRSEFFPLRIDHHEMT